MKKRFGLLRVIAVIFKVKGVIVAAATLLAALFTLVMSVGGGNVWEMVGVDASTGLFAAILAAIIEVVVGALLALMLYGAGELITLLLDVEENTRSAVSLLDKSNEELPAA